MSPNKSFFSRFGESLYASLTRLLAVAAPRLFAKRSSRYISKKNRQQRYQEQARTFERMGGKITHSYPILLEHCDEAGSATGHYFHQDLLVASLIHEKRPVRHIDIGSRVDGFIAHVASFRAIEILDIRPIKNTWHPNISFLQADLMSDTHDFPTADSVSCLHAIEHFGLGRYGDPVDPSGHKKGFRNLLKMVEKGGTLYISFPIANSNEVHFNAHRVFHPLDIFSWAEGEPVKLQRFDYVDDKGDLHQNHDIINAGIDINYGCGIYSFIKT